MHEPFDLVTFASMIGIRNVVRNFYAPTHVKYSPRGLLKSATVEDPHQPPAISDVQSQMPKVPKLHSPEAKMTREFTVGRFDDGILLRNFLKFHLDFPISLIEKLARIRKIWIARGEKRLRKLIPSKTVVQEGDIVKVYHLFKDVGRPDAKAAMLQPPVLEEDLHQVMDNVLYKDEDILVINKPGDLAVHGGTKTATHLQRFLESLKFGNDEAPQLVHRLDKKTSGALILARNRASARTLSEMFRRSADPVEFKTAPKKALPSVDAFGNVVDLVNDDPIEENMSNDCGISIEKTYWAILVGQPTEVADTIDHYLYISPDCGVNISEDVSIKDGTLGTKELVKVRHPARTSPLEANFLKRAITRYEVIQNIGRCGSWVRLMPQTGRKHQLRVHCASVLQSPILGDTKYGEKSLRILHGLGWGQFLDFTRGTGMKGREDGMPMYLHLRQIVLKDYYRYLGAGGRGVDTGKADQKTNYDLVLTAPMSSDWKKLIKSCGLDISRQRV